MARTVNCVVTKMKGAEGLDAPPFPGELGQRIYEQVSRAGWRQWLDRLTTIINENGLNTADVRALGLIEEHMKGFLFNEGGKGGLPAGFRPAGAKK